MERYSLLWATETVGTYKALGMSKGLGAFMSKVGAQDSNKTVETVQELLGGFEKMPGYSDGIGVRPVAVRYAPMHLYRLPDMPDTIQPFYALGMTGPENREGRNTDYKRTVFMSRELMLKQGEFNYLDHIFGTQLLLDQEVESYREGREIYPADLAPEKVMPNYSARDLPFAIRAVEAIYGDKNVILRLEKEPVGSFMERARKLLIQIYSLMQPKLAAETGFAVYQTPEGIAKLCKTTNIRIFVLPAGAELNGLENEGNLILDLSDPSAKAGVKENDLTKTLNQWATSAMSWKNKVACMEKWFVQEESTFQEAEPFVQGSKDGFAAIDAWKKVRESIAGLKSLAELKRFHEVYVAGSLVPWAQEEFEMAVKAAHKGNLSAWLAEAGAAVYILEKDGKREEAIEQLRLYQFGSAYACVGAKEVSQILSVKVGRHDSDATKAELEAEFEKIYNDFKQQITQLQGEIGNAKQALTAEKEKTRTLEQSNHALANEVQLEKENVRRAEEKAERAVEKAQTALALEAELTKTRRQLMNLQRMGTGCNPNTVPESGEKKTKGLAVPLWLAAALIVLSVGLCCLCWFLFGGSESPEAADQIVWNNETSVQNVQAAVPEIKTVITEDVSDYPGLPADVSVLAVFSTDLAPAEEQSSQQPDASAEQSGEMPDASAEQSGEMPDASDPSAEGAGNGVAATGIALSSEDVTMKQGESYKLIATVTPADAEDTVVWSSNNEAALRVEQDGTITNVNKEGVQRDVTVTAQAGNVKATCVIRCKPAEQGKTSMANLAVNEPAAAVVMLTANTTSKTTNSAAGDAALDSASGSSLPADPAPDTGLPAEPAPDGSAVTETEQTTGAAEMQPQKEPSEAEGPWYVNVNHALLLQGNVDAAELAALPNAQMVVAQQDMALVVFGDETMIAAAAKLLDVLGF